MSLVHDLDGLVCQGNGGQVRCELVWLKFKDGVNGGRKGQLMDSAH